MIGYDYSKPQRNWTNLEYKRLLELKKQGYTYQEIGIELNRSKKSCIMKYQQS